MYADRWVCFYIGQLKYHIPILRHREKTPLQTILIFSTRFRKKTWPYYLRRIKIDCPALPPRTWVTQVNHQIRQTSLLEVHQHEEMTSSSNKKNYQWIFFPKLTKFQIKGFFMVINQWISKFWDVSLKSFTIFMDPNKVRNWKFQMNTVRTVQAKIMNSVLR